MQAWGGSLKCDTNKNIAEVAVSLDSWRLQIGTSDRQNKIVSCHCVDIKCTKGQTLSTASSYTLTCFVTTRLRALSMGVAWAKKRDMALVSYVGMSSAAAASALSRLPFLLRDTLAVDEFLQSYEGKGE